MVQGFDDEISFISPKKLEDLKEENKKKLVIHKKTIIQNWN
jgi:hypothetical protein